LGCARLAANAGAGDRTEESCVRAQLLIHQVINSNNNSERDSLPIRLCTMSLAGGGGVGAPNAVAIASGTVATVDAVVAGTHSGEFDALAPGASLVFGTIPKKAAAMVLLTCLQTGTCLADAGGRLRCLPCRTPWGRVF
jgi:hypothetical protein